MDEVRRPMGLRKDLHIKDMLLNDKNKSVRFGRAGRNFVENNFNWKKIAKEFTKIVSRNL